MSANILAMKISLSAEKHLLQHVEKNKACGVKFSMQPDGCAGYGYYVTFPITICDNDVCFTVNDLTVMVDKPSEKLLFNVEIDLKSISLGQKQLVFNNPQVKSECGCGLSVQMNTEK